MSLQGKRWLTEYSIRAIATMSLPSLTKIKMWLYPPGDYSTTTVHDGHQNPRGNR